MWWCSVPGVVVVYHLCTALQSVSIATLTLRRNVLSCLMHCCAGGIPSPWLSGGGFPNIYNSKLWITSGHWQHYAENMFSFEVEKESFTLKPMNCPGHWCVCVRVHMCTCVCVCVLCVYGCMYVCMQCVRTLDGGMHVCFKCEQLCYCNLLISCALPTLP